MSSWAQESKLESLKESWRQFRDARPGERFQQAFERRQKTRKGSLSKVLFVGAGIALIIAGLLFLPAPGPGSIVLVLGVCLLSPVSLFFARTLDWAETRLRGLADWVYGSWTASFAGKIVLVLTAVLMAGAIGFLAYKLLFDR